jgi:hypothetical protein
MRELVPRMLDVPSWRTEREDIQDTKLILTVSRGQNIEIGDPYKRGGDHEECCCNHKADR